VDLIGKRTPIALDVPGSMAFGAVAGILLSPREASAGLVLVLAFTDRALSMRLAPARHRAATGIDARLIVLATSATKFTIADPGDAGMLASGGCQ